MTTTKQANASDRASTYRIPANRRGRAPGRQRPLSGSLDWRSALLGYRVDPRALRVLVPLRLLRRAEPGAREPFLRAGPLHHQGVVGRHGPARRRALHAADGGVRRSSSIPLVLLDPAALSLDARAAAARRAQTRTRPGTTPPRTRRPSPRRAASFATSQPRCATCPVAEPEAASPRGGERGGAIVEHKRRYLNRQFFLVRLIFYLLTWSWLAQRYFRWSTEQDKTKALENTAGRPALRARRADPLRLSPSPSSPSTGSCRSTPPGTRRSSASRSSRSRALPDGVAHPR